MYLHQQSELLHSLSTEQNVDKESEYKANYCSIFSITADREFVNCCGQLKQ